VLLSVVGGFFVLAALVGIFVVIVVANRAEPDPTGRRPLAVYFFGVSFFMVYAALFASLGIVLSLVQLIGTHNGGQSSVNSIHPVGDAVARVVILSGIIVVVAVAVLFVHLRRGLEVSGRADPRMGPLGRVAQSYVTAVCFVAVIVTVVALVIALYETARIIAPGVFQVNGSRVDTLRPMLAAAYLALAALVVLMVHMRFVPLEVRRVSWTLLRPVQGPEADPGFPGPSPSPPHSDHQPPDQPPGQPSPPPPPPFQ
jgi:hypothetical protein